MAVDHRTRVRVGHRISTSLPPSHFVKKNTNCLNTRLNFHGKQLSDPKDRQDIAEATLGAVDAMELSGRIDPDAAKRLRFSSKRVLYGSQGWEGRDADEEEMRSLQSGKNSGGTGRANSVITDGHFSRKRGVI